MITFKNSGRLVESTSELPELFNSKRLYADFEATSGRRDIASKTPWTDCDIAGIAITVDNKQGAWYVPVGHHQGNNLPKDIVYDWWYKVVDTTKEWINHNVKYDAHVSTNYAGVRPDCPLKCTLTRAKLIDSDRIMRGGYSLDALSKGWLHEDIDGFEAALQPYLHRNKDYGAIPIDVLGEYACQDVLTNRRLDHYIEARLHEQCEAVAATEQALTGILFDMEQRGFCIDPQELQTSEFKLLHRMSQLDEESHKLVGRNFNAISNADCYDVLCNQYGLPVLDWTDKGEPSFDKKALAQYAAHPFAPHDVVKRILEYRQRSVNYSLFIKKWRTIHDEEGVIHPSYNQAVRTGRMSCKDPNATQLNKFAKAHVHPREGHSFLSVDYAQIEFRLIVHYINDHDAIEAYEENRDTDFHAWVAEMCKIKRGPAKNVNFCMGYGGGKAKVLSMLESNMELVGSLKKHVDDLITEQKVPEKDALHTFHMLAQRRALSVYEQYHATLPGLKRTSRRASNALKSKGYVFNLFGRHRHLPKEKAHIAFNTLNQSSAADLVKERMVALHQVLKDKPIHMLLQVHDELLFEGPSEVINDPRTARDIIGIMENPNVELRVPIRCSYGISESNWAEASAGEELINEPGENLEWL